VTYPSEAILWDILVPVSDAPEGHQDLKEHTPEGPERLVEYFSSTYVLDHIAESSVQMMSSLHEDS
jgi:hypothetical protein